MDQILAYIGAGFVAFWGIAHLFPTKNVVADFGEISEDNCNIITMEWIVEGVALIFTGFKVSFIMFKLCPVIFTGASILILLGILL